LISRFAPERSADQSIDVSTMASMTTGLTVSCFGTEEQKRKWLPEIISGQKICSIAGTAPDAGSDTGGFTTRATQLGNGQWSLSGEKAFITNAGTPISLFTLILAMTSPKDEERK
jgi:alkylation response protein AidB-like acyl-CoA dehydrogenase